MAYLIFPAGQAAALAASDLIFKSGLIPAAARGYRLTNNGVLAKNGVGRDGGESTGWDTPRECVGGFAIVGPERNEEFYREVRPAIPFSVVEQIGLPPGSMDWDGFAKAVSAHELNSKPISAQDVTSVQALSGGEWVSGLLAALRLEYEVSASPDFVVYDD